MIENINFSCADLIKKSAKTICYFRKKKKQQEVTPAMIKGNQMAEKKTISELKEMRGTYNIDNLLIHYTFDEIQKKNNKIVLIEHKNIEDESDVEEWYVNYSLLQVALYRALLEINPSKEYFTAKFFRKEGFNTNYIKIENEKIKSILYIGDKKYKVKINSAHEIVNFYITKAKATFDYDSAIEWDVKWI
jgi:hypothetical protein